MADAFPWPFKRALCHMATTVIMDDDRWRRLLASARALLITIIDIVSPLRCARYFPLKLFIVNTNCNSSAALTYLEHALMWYSLRSRRRPLQIAVARVCWLVLKVRHLFFTYFYMYFFFSRTRNSFKLMIDLSKRSHFEAMSLFKYLVFARQRHGSRLQSHCIVIVIKFASTRNLPIHPSIHLASQPTVCLFWHRVASIAFLL